MRQNNGIQRHQMTLRKFAVEIHIGKTVFVAKVIDV